MIVGIGTDVVDIERIKQIFIKYRQRFLSHILSPEELEIFPSIPERQHAYYLAKRFAAKEAFSKALGTGFQKGLALSDISILNTDLGKPYVKLSKKAWTLVEKLTGQKNSVNVHVSLSDEHHIAAAFIVIEAL